MWIFLAALGMLFLASVVGYLVVRLRAEAWPPPGMPRLPSGLWASTLVLLGTSVAIHLALRNVRVGKTNALRRWLVVTFALGAAFLAMQAANWWDLVTADVTWRTRNLYAFTFFMLTGLHAAHVVGGLVSLGVVLIKAWLGRYDSGYHPGVLYAAMYWHFLDAVWVALFVVLVVAA